SNLSVNSSGNAYISNASSVTLTGSTITVGSGDVLSLATTSGNIAVNGNVGSGSSIGTINLNAAGAITETTGTLTATTVDLTSNGGDIGANSNAINTAASNLSVTSSGNAYINNAGSVTLTGSTITVGSGDVLSLATSSGNIAVGGNVGSGSRIGSIALNAAGGISETSGTLTATNVNLASGSGSVGATGSG